MAASPLVSSAMRHLLLIGGKKKRHVPVGNSGIRALLCQTPEYLCRLNCKSPLHCTVSQNEDQDVNTEPAKRAPKYSERAATAETLKTRRADPV